MVQHSATPYINVARIVRTHGKKGEVVVAALDGLPFCLDVGMRVCLTPPPLRGERFHTVERVGAGETPLVAFSGIRSISDADAIVGNLVLALRDDVPEAVHERSMLDCVGCTVVDERHGDLGVIEEYMQLPANDVWVVRGPRYGEVLIPVIEDVVLGLPDDGSDAVRVRLMPGILPEV